MGFYYSDWTKAIFNEFFNDDEKGKEVLFCIDETILKDIYKLPTSLKK